MPIPLPNLDDRTFADLVDELRALIPRYAPEWTNHNLSDPGMTLIDLFAWLTETLIYRLNRITSASEARFLELLGAKFEEAKPATTRVIVTATELTAPLLIPRSAPLLAGSDVTGTGLGFETLQVLQLTPESPGGTVEVRQAIFVEKENMGASTGEPHQAFSLNQGFLLSDPLQILPKVTVGGTVWIYKANLLESRGKDPHFTTEPRSNSICFGDGKLGQIPGKGAAVVVSYYATQGIAGNVPAGTPFTFDTSSARLPGSVREALRTGVSFSIRSGRAGSGGAGPTGLDEARQQTVSRLKQRSRAITGRDFEQLILAETDFKIARATCVPERVLTSADPETPRPGHVSIVIVPDTTDEKPFPTLECIEQVWGFIEQRRLLTCRHHLLGPGYTEVRIRTAVIRKGQVPESMVLSEVQKTLQAFFHPLTGGPQSNGEGWPFGRDVYVSEVYQIIEETDGVDHVESLTLYSREETADWAEAGNQVIIGPRNLVYFDLALSEIVVRTIP
jgi:predicted phage baseplate assembly protein